MLSAGVEDASELSAFELSGFDCSDAELSDLLDASEAALDEEPDLDELEEPSDFELEDELCPDFDLEDEEELDFDEEEDALELPDENEKLELG